MAIIRVNTEQLRQTSSRIRNSNGDLVQIGYQLQQAIGNLDTGGWTGESRYQIEPLLDQVGARINDIVHCFDELAYRLLRVANIFEDRDESIALQITELPWGWTLIPQESPGTSESEETNEHELEEIPSRNIIDLIGELLKPIHWVNDQHADKQFIETLKQIGRILNSLTGERGYVKRMEALGDVLMAGEMTWDDLTGPLGNLFFIYDSTEFLSGEMTNKEFASEAIGVILDLIPIPFLGQKIADWFASNVPCPDGTFKIKAGEPN